MPMLVREPNPPRAIRAVWAVDPTEKNDGALHHRARKTIRRIVDACADTVVEPVYVFRLSTAVTADAGKSFRNELVEQAENALQTFVRRAKIPGLAPPRVLVSSSSSFARAAEILAEHANRFGADLLIAQTHARSGLGRFVLGSFAETLLTTAKTPVLLVNPKTSVDRRFDRILFPTNFGARAGGQLRAVLDLAARFGSKVTLFHALEDETEKALLYSSIAGPIAILPDRRREIRARLEKHAAHWIAVAARYGVAMDVVFRDRCRNPGEDIVKCARAMGASLIAMETNTSPVAAMLVGSNTRTVVRKSPCPVWVLKPSPRRKNLERGAGPELGSPPPVPPAEWPDFSSL